MNALGSLLRIGEKRTDSTGNLKFPNFRLLIKIATQAEMNFDKAISLIEIHDNSTVRVIKEGNNSVIFSIKIDDKFEYICQHSHPIGVYKDAKHPQVRGGGYIEWINEDFENKFDAESILKSLGWHRLQKYLTENNRDIVDISETDELICC